MIEEAKISYKFWQRIEESENPACDDEDEVEVSGLLSCPQREPDFVMNVTGETRNTTPLAS